MNLDYDLEIDNISKYIKDKNYTNILLQFPDGFKYYSKEVVDELKIKNPKTNFFIFLGTCYGACDLPQELSNIDLIVQWGHTKFVKQKKW